MELAKCLRTRQERSGTWQTRFAVDGSDIATNGEQTATTNRSFKHVEASRITKICDEFNEPNFVAKRMTDRETLLGSLIVALVDSLL